MNWDPVLEYAIPGASTLAWYTVIRCIQAKNVCVKLNPKILTNLKWAYKEFSNSIPASSINEPAFCLAVERIWRLHNTNNLVATTSQSLDVSIGIAIMGFFAVFGLLVTSWSQPDWWPVDDNWLVVITPGVLLVVQGWVLVRSIKGHLAVRGVEAELEEDRENYKSDWTAS